MIVLETCETCLVRDRPIERLDSAIASGTNMFPLVNEKVVVA